ncbi:MAG: glycosyltransferase [Deltaproteobacteria bacterium]
MFGFTNKKLPTRIEISNTARAERVSIILPVLNEATRIETCLDGLILQPEEVAEILIVDGGSSDGTQAIVDRYRLRDVRVTLIDASPVDEHYTGKAWGLHFGLQRSNAESQWILCVDADVRVSPILVRSLLAHAERTGVSTFSVATLQRLSGKIEGLIHPALLTTLIYRFGAPGKATRNRHRVQANGQCFISRRATLLRTEAFRAAQASLCEDITIVRRLAECGEAIGFYESDGLVEVSMYNNWRETWNNWPRSLPMRDQYFGWREWLGLCKVFLFQALPLPVFLFSTFFGRLSWPMFLTGTLALLRLGILAGTARAYLSRPWTFWLSPLCDLPVALKLVTSAFARKHVWRGRVYVRCAGGGFEFVEHWEDESREQSAKR